MRIVVLAPDVPYPANRGGRADVWRRIQAMSSLGHQVFLVAPIGTSTSTPSPNEERTIDSVVTGRFFFTINRGWWRTLYRLSRLMQVPWHAATRIPNQHIFDQLLERVTSFKPDAVWLDGPWLGVIAEKLSCSLSLPQLYRSHNVEFDYMLGQAKTAASLRDRLALSVSCVGLKRFEINTLKQAIGVFDISVDDLRYWEGVGMQHMHWLPPLPELALKDKPSESISGDIVFLGNLGTPNNVRGVEWLVMEVLPRVQTRLPGVRCRIVGSNPTPFVSRLLAGATGVELCANVPDPTPYLFGARVLVNPVMTGSGVQVKMLDMLMTDAPIVTASQGTRGLPNEFRQLFRIADNADAFANAVCEELSASTVNVPARTAAREVFSVAAVGRALDMVSHSRKVAARG
jgi:polysaccharide biosynthesis protein PslH